MWSWNFLGTYSLVCAYLGISALSTMMVLAEPTWLTGRAVRHLPSDRESETWGGHAQNHEGFFAGLEDGDMATQGLSMDDRQALSPYVGILCGSDSP